jgi:glycosyltransferase involved in cell wall biosynthesis
MRRRNVGFVSFRFAGTDGVSLETSKWATVLESMGHRCYYCGGELETPSERSILLPKAQFKHPEIQEISSTLFDTDTRKPWITERIHELRQELKESIHEFIERFSLDLLVAENTLSIPLNIPLGLAITEVIAETRIATIAHHHDFTWERKRFMVSCVSDYLRNAFPPRLHSVVHVVINSTARNQLALRSGCNAYLIPNVMDFDNPPAGIDGYNADVRDALGLAADDTFVLQPTRVVQRKGIEHAIELVKHLDQDGNMILVISHASGDEGFEYQQRVRNYAKLLGIRALFVDELIDHRRGTTPDGRKIYSLDDVYPHADLVTYPSLFEGFGNAFLEAVYHRKPIFVNNYSIYASDIRPKGFRTILMDEYISDRVLGEARRFLGDADYRQWAIEHNYTVARKHYSYRVLESSLSHILMSFFGLDDPD